MAQLAVLSVIAAIAIWIPYRWISDPGVDRIRLQIEDATSLEVDAPVMMQGMDVGRVESVVLDQGRAVAELEIDGRWYEEIPAGSEFMIGSLNTLMPGNVGIQILPPDDLTTVGEVNLVDGVRTEVASDRILPRQTPMGLYLAIGAAVLVFAIALGIALNIAKSTILIKLVIAFALAVGAFIAVKETVLMPSIQEQIDKLNQVDLLSK